MAFPFMVRVYCDALIICSDGLPVLGYLAVVVLVRGDVLAAFLLWTDKVPLMLCRLTLATFGVGCVTSVVRAVVHLL